MPSLEHLRADILGTLRQTRLDAGEPRIGVREVELVRSSRGVPARLVWAALRALRAEGRIKRSGGYTWISEEEFIRTTRPPDQQENAPG